MLSVSSFEKKRLNAAVIVMKSSFDWTLLSEADTTDYIQCNRSLRIRSTVANEKDGFNTKAA